MASSICKLCSVSSDELYSLEVAQMSFGLFAVSTHLDNETYTLICIHLQFSLFLPPEGGRSQIL